MRTRSGLLSGSRRPLFDLRLGDATLVLGRETKLLGVLNVTPDSFSDGGRYSDPGRAERRALEMQAEGAHMIDVGGESSRPGSKAVSAREEIRRIRPVLKRLARSLRIPFSVDTYKDEVAAAALDEGARMINDIRSLRGNRRMARRIARYGAAVTLMHMQGDPRTMQKKPHYADVVREVRESLAGSARLALESGIRRSSVLVDPGFGFGKTMEHNLELLSHLDSFASLKLPVLVGLSRKSFIGSLLGQPDPQQRLTGSLAAAAVAIQRGAHFLRVHDVLAHRQLTALMDRTALS